MWASPVYGQAEIEEKLRKACFNAGSDSERVVRLNDLARFYIATREFSKGDSTIERQIMIAESTQNQRLILFSYFNNAGYRSSNASNKDRSASTISYVNRALGYARANELTDYQAIAYSSLALAHLSDGRTEEALKNANFAFTTALNTTNDSAKVVCGVQLGNVYQHRSDVLMAFKTYTNAQNIAIESGDESLLPPVYHAIASLYKKLGNEENAKKYVHRSLGINKTLNNIPGIINDHIFLAKMSNYIAGKQYLQEAVDMAESIGDMESKIEAERILFVHMLLQEKPGTMLSYLETNKELEMVFLNSGPGYLDWMLAEIYLYGGDADSALFYFRRAEPGFNSGYDINLRKNFFSEFAYTCRLRGDEIAAIRYYSQAYDLARVTSDLMSLKSFSNELKNLYDLAGDHKQAYAFSVKYDGYKDSVDILGREKDLALLEIENVTRQAQRDEELAKAEQRRKYNIQYMLITIIVAAAFLLMIMVGMFKVSAFTIRLMGFFSLIFFFEFIILILDTRIHHMTHGEPWKIWLIKIGIISILLPLHHFLEHRLIRYLLSRHLIFVRSRLNPGSLFRKRKKPAPEPVSPEESTVA